MKMTKPVFILGSNI